MHLKAIAIKEQLLGSDDYEVGLSVGHLASLYNYHMLQYREAETLYHRSIAISMESFTIMIENLYAIFKRNHLNDLNHNIRLCTLLVVFIGVLRFWNASLCSLARFLNFCFLEQCIYDAGQFFKFIFLIIVLFFYVFYS